MTKIKVKGLKWKRLEVRGPVLHFCLFSSIGANTIIIEERCYIYNIFTTNYRWLVVVGSNLKLILRSLFCPNNNN